MNEQLSINDLMLVKQIIEVVHKRNGFDITELSAVGTLYNKLDSFLTASQEQLAQQSAEQPTQPTISQEDEATARSVVGI